MVTINSMIYLQMHIFGCIFYYECCFFAGNQTLSAQMKLVVPVIGLTVWMTYCCFGTSDLLLLSPLYWKFSYNADSELDFRLLVCYVGLVNAIIPNVTMCMDRLLLFFLYGIGVLCNFIPLLWIMGNNMTHLWSYCIMYGNIRSNYGYHSTIVRTSIYLLYWKTLLLLCWKVGHLSCIS